MNEIVCPQCDTPNTYDRLIAHADNFCTKCDYPLFLFEEHVATVPTGEPGEGTLRRLPGVGGRDGRAMRPCPECAEPNLVAAAKCIRCDSLMDPPPPPPPPAPEPVVEAPVWEPVDKGIDWVFVVLLVIAAALIGFLVYYGITA